MAYLKMCFLIFVSKDISNKCFVLRIAVIPKKRRQHFSCKLLGEKYINQHGDAAVKFKLRRHSYVHVEISGDIEPRSTSTTEDPNLLPVQRSGCWRDYGLICGEGFGLVDVVFREEGPEGKYLHSAVVNLSQLRGTEQTGVSGCDHDVQLSKWKSVDQYSQTEYAGDKKEESSTNRRRKVTTKQVLKDVAEVLPSPRNSMVISDLEDSGSSNSETCVAVLAPKLSTAGHETVSDELLTKQRLYKLVEQMEPAESFRLILGLGVPDVKKKQEEHREKDVVSVYYNLLVYWLDKMMVNKKKDALNKLIHELGQVREDLATSLREEHANACKIKGEDEKSVLKTPKRSEIRSHNNAISLVADI